MEQSSSSQELQQLQHRPQQDEQSKFNNSDNHTTNPDSINIEEHEDHRIIITSDSSHGEIHNQDENLDNLASLDILDKNTTNTEPNKDQQQEQYPEMVVSMIASASIGHALNDLVQAVLPSIYPLLKTNFNLSFTEIGLIAFIYQLTASLLQPFVGLYTDKHPMPYLLPCGMIMTMIGIGLLSIANHFSLLALSAITIGIGSSIFHPEASRVARMASGGKFGTAQSAFQVGGNSGSAIGPLLVAWIVVPRTQGAVAWFMLFTLIGFCVLSYVSYFVVNFPHKLLIKKKGSGNQQGGLHGQTLYRALIVISVLLVVKFTYIASIKDYYIFYLMTVFSLTVTQSQIYLFIFLASVALGTYIGGPIGDKIGRKAVIWISFLGIIPFSVALPWLNLPLTIIASIIIGAVISSAFSAMIVYAQEAVPGNVGLVSGLMFGAMFGIGGIASALLGLCADKYGIAAVYKVCAFIPLLGGLTIFLPNSKQQ